MHNFASTKHTDNRLLNDCLQLHGHLHNIVFTEKQSEPKNFIKHSRIHLHKTPSPG